MPLLLDDRTETRALAEAAVLEIGLLNNLSDAGLKGGDRQIVELLGEVAGQRTARLRFFSLPSIQRGTSGREYIESRYSTFEALTATRLDGLIVTGCEPRCHLLSDEAFWPQLTEIIDWAEHNTVSTIWSCLAAHAAVLHLDGIERRSLTAKCTGLFEVEPVGAHPLSVGMAPRLRVPHSRWNGLNPEELAAAGYQVLTRSAEVGVDTFTKQWRSLFIYLHGHPEYDADALRREYRRDVMRYLEGTSDTYPTLPSHYFGADAEQKLRAFEACAVGKRDARLAAAFPLERRRAPWQRTFARALFGNWLNLLQGKETERAASLS